MKSELEHHYILWSRPSWAVTLKCNNAYIIVAPEIIQENRCFHLAAFSCWVSEKVLVFFIFASFFFFIRQFQNHIKGPEKTNPYDL